MKRFARVTIRLLEEDESSVSSRTFFLEDDDDRDALDKIPIVLYFAIEGGTKERLATLAEAITTADRMDDYSNEKAPKALIRAAQEFLADQKKQNDDKIEALKKGFR